MTTATIRDYAGRWIPQPLRSTFDATAWFLESLYAPALGAQDAHIELRPEPTWNPKPEKNLGPDPLRIWLPLRSLDDLSLIAFEAYRIDAAVSRRTNRRFDPPRPGQLYFGVNPRLFGAGDQPGVVGLVAAYADIELVKKGVDTHHALRVLSSLPCKASAILWSGRGLHVYWFLAKMAPRMDIERLEALNRGIAHRLKGIGSDPGIHDCTRILRLPGTHNRKAGSVPVELLAMDPARRYKLWDLENAFPVHDPLPEKGIFAPINLSFRAPALLWVGEYHPSVLQHLAKCRALGASNSDIEQEAQRCAAEWGQRGQKSVANALKMSKWVSKKPVGQRMRRLRPAPASYYVREGR